MTLKQKIRRFHEAQAKAKQLEQEIKAEAIPILRAEGVLAVPRFERIIERFAA